MSFEYFILIDSLYKSLWWYKMKIFKNEHLNYFDSWVAVAAVAIALVLAAIVAIGSLLVLTIYGQNQNWIFKYFFFYFFACQYKLL